MLTLNKQMLAGVVRTSTWHLSVDFEEQNYISMIILSWKKNSFKCVLLFFLSGITLDPEYNMLYIADSVGSLLPFFELT